MRNLLNFLLRYNTWLLFLVYVALGCWMLFSNNPYQRHAYLTSAGAVTGAIYDISGSVTGYISLRDINEDLQKRNATLEMEAIDLRSQIDVLNQQIMQDSLRKSPTQGQFAFILASVVNNSVSHPNNYITINKGSEDGIAPEMGVMDQNGVVGVVDVVSKHHARVISLLNPNFHLSCKLRGNDAFGSLVWNGRNSSEAILEELPKQVRYKVGDTIITSGFSSLFPAGIPVGVIKGDANGDDNFHTLRVKLFTDFNTLSTVKVISNRDIDDIKAVENVVKTQ